MAAQFLTHDREQALFTNAPIFLLGRFKTWVMSSPKVNRSPLMADPDAKTILARVKQKPPFLLRDRFDVFKHYMNLPDISLAPPFMVRALLNDGLLRERMEAAVGLSYFVSCFGVTASQAQIKDWQASLGEDAVRFAMAQTWLTSNRPDITPSIEYMRMAGKVGVELWLSSNSTVCAWLNATSDFNYSGVFNRARLKEIAANASDFFSNAQNRRG